MADRCLAAAKTLEDTHGVACELVFVSRLAPLDAPAIAKWVSKHGRAVVVEEGPRSFGWTAELSSILTERCFDVLEAPVARVGAASESIGAAPHLEAATLPGEEDIVAAVLGLWS